jgi:hypothetical protein
VRPGGLYAVALIAAFVGSVAEAQGLGEAAAREKQRREQEQKKRGAAKVVTMDDLSKTGSSDNPASGTAQDQQRPERSTTEQSRTIKEGTDEVVDETPKEAEWRQRAKDAKEELQQAEAQLRKLEEKASQLFGQIQASTDTNELLRLRAEQQGLTKQVEEAKAVLASCRKEMGDLADEARKAGVPPGWVR